MSLCCFQDNLFSLTFRSLIFPFRWTYLLFNLLLEFWIINYIFLFQKGCFSFNLLLLTFNTHFGYNFIYLNSFFIVFFFFNSGCDHFNVKALGVFVCTYVTLVHGSLGIFDSHLNVWHCHWLKLCMFFCRVELHLCLPGDRVCTQAGSNFASKGEDSIWVILVKLPPPGRWQKA